MTLFEQLKLFPKIDLHVDFLGSITKETILKLTNNTLTYQEVEEVLVLSSVKDYDNARKIVANVLNSLENIEMATIDLIEKLKKGNLLYVEIFLNLNLFSKTLNKKEVLKTILKVFEKSDVKASIVLEIESRITKDEMYENLNLLYEFYKKGITSVYFKKDKQENFDSYQALYDKFIKDDIDYIVLLDSKITNQNKEIYYNAKRIIYNVMDLPSDNFLNLIRDNEIILEFPITYQNYFNLFDDLSNHFIYDLYKENVLITFTTIAMTSLDTDILNEYCKLFNVFPFSLHDLVVITLNNLNKLNIKDGLKNHLIDDFKDKANELL